YREAIRLEPDDIEVHHHIGSILKSQHNLDQAIAAYREAIRIKPDDALSHGFLGFTLYEDGKHDDAIAELREAIRLKPDYAEAHCSLGHFLRHRGRHSEALASLRRGHELGTKQPGWRAPSAKWVSDCERLVAIEGKLPAILKGEAQPANADEQLALAQLCHE